MSRKSRKFTEDDLLVWRRVKSTIKPLDERAKESSTSERESRLRSGNKPVGSPAPLLSREPNISTDLKSHLPTRHIDGLHRSQRRLIRKGQIEADAVLDLHGMRLEQAYLRFYQFIQSSGQNGARVVLVVTGKGGHARLSDFGVEISGVIKRAFPEWMRDPAITPLVHHFSPAHIKHGGEGAWYVFLRNPKKRETLQQKHRR